MTQGPGRFHRVYFSAKPLLARANCKTFHAHHLYEYAFQSQCMALGEDTVLPAPVMIMWRYSEFVVPYQPIMNGYDDRIRRFIVLK